MAETAHTTSTEAHGGAAQHGGAFPPFDPSTFPSQILWFALTFGVFFLLVSKLLVPRIGGIIETRRDRIVRDLGEAERLKAETDAAVAAYEKALAEARAKAQGIAAATHAELTAATEAKRAATEASLTAKLTDAEARIADIKAKAMADVDQIAIDTAETLVSTLIGTGVSREEVAAAVSASLTK
ncbi:F0F1 ATP synthase subunit B [Methyloraptor flagellatus]|uniref:ATP synthase subunit b n=1 Tax=Methyloraptor flagellatus TaxID=3162530 RepID=A0AAU7X5T5_9HYPH